MELNDEMHRGHKAAELLENTLLQEALKAIEGEVVEQWAACPARDKDGKEALWQLMKTAQKFRHILTGYVETGKLASETLKRFEEKKGLRDVLRRIA
jgi:hypothetical protein